MVDENLDDQFVDFVVPEILSLPHGEEMFLSQCRPMPWSKFGRCENGVLQSTSSSLTSGDMVRFVSRPFGDY